MPHSPGPWLTEGSGQPGAPSLLNAAAPRVPSPAAPKSAGVAPALNHWGIPLTPGGSSQLGASAVSSSAPAAGARAHIFPTATWPAGCGPGPMPQLLVPGVRPPDSSSRYGLVWAASGREQPVSPPHPQVWTAWMQTLQDLTWAAYAEGYRSGFESGSIIGGGHLARECSRSRDEA